MGLPQDTMSPLPIEPVAAAENPLNKRRRFGPISLPPTIASIDNSDIENHTFDSPLLLQLCEQAPLPEEIEADLLQVGMRIRKAVSGGYKTKRFTPRPFFNVRALSPETQAALCRMSAPESSPTRSPLAMQPISTATFCGINLSAMPAWDSPEYIEPQLWKYSTSHKRGFELEDESDEQEWLPQTPTLFANAGAAMPLDYFNIDMENRADVSPFTLVKAHRRQNSIPFKQTSGPELNTMTTDRRLVQPKTRVRRQPVATPPAAGLFNPFASLAMIPEPQPAAMPTSHHTRVLSCGMEANFAFGDFAEATFLQPRQDVEMDCS